MRSCQPYDHVTLLVQGKPSGWVQPKYTTPREFSPSGSRGGSWRDVEGKKIWCMVAGFTRAQLAANKTGVQLCQQQMSLEGDSSPELHVRA